MNLFRAGNPSQNPRVGPSRPVKTRARPGSAAESPTLLSKLHRFTEVTEKLLDSSKDQRQIGVLVKSLNFGLSSLDKWLSPKSGRIPLLFFPASGEVAPIYKYTTLVLVCLYLLFIHLLS
ncbi:hypothetical protein C5167_016422 [Papaver somniferum]|nr:hypothetical protein C5167_016422 [Papaver somniferum]